MNRSALAVLTAAFVLGAAFAAPAVATAGPAAGSTLLVSCEAGSRPSQREIGRLLEADNAGQVYAARARLIAEVRRACHRTGVRQVALMGRHSVPVAGRSEALAGQH